jgi:hypothetical protein
MPALRLDIPRPAIGGRLLPRRSGSPPGRWQAVAAKELGDNVRSVRFLILLGLIGAACVAAVISAANFLRDVAEGATDAPSPFLLLFTESPERIPSFVVFLGFLGPLSTRSAPTARCRGSSPSRFTATTSSTGSSPPGSPPSVRRSFRWWPSPPGSG